LGKHEDFDRDTWSDLLEIKNPWVRGWFLDEEAAEASAISSRGLRTLQALKFTRANLASRRKGARIRLWSTEDVLRASLANEFSHFAGIAAPTAVRLLQLVPEWIVDELVGQTATLVNGCANAPDELVTDYGWLSGDRRIVRQEAGDICLVIVDAEHVFIDGRFPELVEHAEPGVRTEPVGWVRNVYSRDPDMGKVEEQLDETERQRLISTFDHPIAATRFNLELALRWRVSNALGLTPSR